MFLMLYAFIHVKHRLSDQRSCAVMVCAEKCRHVVCMKFCFKDDYRKYFYNSTVLIKHIERIVLMSEKDLVFN
jgi:hypothetical protein